jgi:hypothetical protein
MGPSSMTRIEIINSGLWPLDVEVPDTRRMN